MMREPKNTLLFRILFWIMLVVLFVYLVGGELLLPSEWDGELYDFTTFDVQWQRVYEDGTREAFTIPSKCVEQKGEVVVLETQIPREHLQHSSIMFWNECNNTKIYVDGELRREFDLKDSRLIGDGSPAVYDVFEFQPGDEGKTLTFVCSNNYAGTYSFQTIYYGDKMGMWLLVLKENLAAVLVAGLAVFLAIIGLGVSVVLERIFHDVVSMKYLSWGVLLTSIWVLANSSMRQLIFPNISVISDIAFILPGIIPMPFLMYINVAQQRKYCFLFRLCEIAVFIDFVVCNTLVLLNFQTYTEIFPVIASGCILAVLLILVTILKDMASGEVHRYRTPAVCMMLICIAGLIQIAFYMMKLKVSYSGSIIAIALLLMMANALYGTMRDMLRLSEEKEEAVFASKSKAQFLANMSHEIRTPINAVLGMNEMILREETKPEILEYAKDIQSAGRSLLALVNDILDFSKIESGRMELIPVEYEVSSLLNDSYNLLALRAQDKGLVLQFRHNSEMPRRLLGDEIRIRQIMVNLLTNGIKYTESGTVSLFMDYEEIDEEQILLKIEVQDTGRGITEEDQKKLFQSFQRVEEKRNRSIEGSGLGLSITKQLLDLMDGTITLESEYGTGSVFRVEIPQEVVLRDPVGDWTVHETGQDTNAPAVHRMSFQAPKARILIVDDVPMNLKVLGNLLKETKMQIDMVESGQACLEKVCRETYDIIFLDHMMPEMDGVETLQRMRRLKGNLNWQTPVVMLTANAIVGAREEYMEKGFSDYLSKPVESAKLDEILCRYLPKDQITRFGYDKEGSSLTLLDVEAGLVYSGGSEEIYKQMLQMYLDGDKTKQIRECYDKKDWDNYCLQMYALKSTSLSIGALGLSELAKKLEYAARNGEIEVIVTEHDVLLYGYQELMGILKERLK